MTFFVELWILSRAIKVHLDAQLFASGLEFPQLVFVSHLIDAIAEELSLVLEAELA